MTRHIAVPLNHQELVGKKIETKKRRRRCKVRKCNTSLSQYNFNSYCWAHNKTYGFTNMLKEDKRQEEEHRIRNLKGVVKRNKKLTKLKQKTKIREKKK